MCNLRDETMKRKELLSKIKNVIKEIEPESDIILYGSRARGEHKPDSDWDFLILLNGEVDVARTDRIRHRLYDIETESEEIISSIVRSRKAWQCHPYCITPLHERIESEGVSL